MEDQTVLSCHQVGCILFWIQRGLNTKWLAGAEAITIALTTRPPSQLALAVYKYVSLYTSLVAALTYEPVL